MDAALAGLVVWGGYVRRALPYAGECQAFSLFPPPCKGAIH